ncbi:unnamed protein product [Owenia fusiformis]|uniref:Uncharacterized protein n=1 Tax=Owenia fusiformis TaxID=6347 RepID=A0A8S4N7K0_OWEFU|nr:unnamed protein product [Owenia fusiformis]
MNITTVLKSAHLEAKSTLFTTVIPICSSVSRLLWGVLPDYILKNWKRLPISSVMLLTCFMDCICQTLFIFFNQDFLALFCTSIFIRVVQGGFFVFLPVVVIELFGDKYFGQNLGITLISQGLGALVFQEIFGLVYDSNTPARSNECYGEMCSRLSFAISAIMALVASCLNILLIYAEWCSRNIQQ